MSYHFKGFGQVMPVFNPVESAREAPDLSQFKMTFEREITPQPTGTIVSAGGAVSPVPLDFQMQFEREIAPPVPTDFVLTYEKEIFPMITVGGGGSVSPSNFIPPESFDQGGGGVLPPGAPGAGAGTSYKPPGVPPSGTKCAGDAGPVTVTQFGTACINRGGQAAPGPACKFRDGSSLLLDQNGCVVYGSAGSGAGSGSGGGGGAVAVAAVGLAALMFLK